MAVTKCRVENCDLAISARGMCSSHYNKERRTAGGSFNSRPMYEYDCIYCGRKCNSKRSDARYCEIHATPYHRTGRGFVRCKRCETWFYQRTVVSTYCSDRCASKNYNQARKLQRTLYQRLRNSKVKSQLFEISNRDIRRLRYRQSDKCFYCSASSPGSLDHLIPVSRGGPTSIGNLVLCCRSCNSRKGSKTVMEFRMWVSERLYGSLGCDEVMIHLRQDNPDAIIDPNWPLKIKGD